MIADLSRLMVDPERSVDSPSPQKEILNPSREAPVGVVPPAMRHSSEVAPADPRGELGERAEPAPARGADWRAVADRILRSVKR
ncbi:MAG: hypothetical protein E6J91_14160 [Deltaproteobacteria bacterium]|nr:MAG: hypothetical protein E6J91_14160 [Deltaproteobacteria bacterium]